jgi:ABC-type oligopeptide transport system substrate-binding subunit
MRRNPITRCLLLLLLVLGIGAGVFVATVAAATGLRGAVEGKQPAVKDGGTLLVGVREFDVIDPALARPPDTTYPFATATWPAEDATCALLLRYPVGPPPIVHYRLVPEVAATLPAVSGDGKTYTFTIRKGYRFSTGAPVTAANYAREMNRILDPSIDSFAAQYLKEVVGAVAVRKREAHTATGIRAVGNRLIVRLTKRVPDFPARMTMPYFCPVPGDLPVAPEGVQAPLPGSGPYYIAEFVPGNRVVLKRNRFYGGRRTRHVDQIFIQVGEDASTTTRRVDAGEEDVALSTGPREKSAELLARLGTNRRQLYSIPSPTVFYVVMNTSRRLFKNNPKLRQAVNFAVDRTRMAEVNGPLALVGSLTDDYLPLGMPGYVDAHLYPLEHPKLARARALAQGHTRSGTGVLYICDNSVPPCVLHGQILQETLKQIGIELEIKAFPYAIKEDKLATKDEPWDITVERHDVAYVDPTQFIDLMLDGRTIHARENTNRAYFDADRYNLLIKQAGRRSGNARYDAYGKLAVDLARNAAPLAALNVRHDRFFVSSRVGCVQVAAHGGLDLTGLCLNY